MTPLAPTGNGSLLSARDVTLRYGKVRALDRVSITLHHGVTALVGPNGAGKTTLLRLLAGVSKPDAGVLTVHGEVLAGRTLRRFRRQLGYLPQRPSWHGWMRCRDALRLFAWLHGMERRSIDAAVERALRAVDLPDSGDRRVEQLSGGQSQRLMLAATLVHDPRVLLLDEPTVGLDPEQRLHFRDIVTHAAEGRCVLISTHLMDDVATTASRLVVLDRGSTVFEGSPVELTARFSGAAMPLSTDLESAYIRLLRDGRAGSR